MVAVVFNPSAWETKAVDFQGKLASCARISELRFSGRACLNK